MKLCKQAAVVAVLVVAGAASAAMAPTVVHGQAFAWAAEPQAVQIFAGGGRIGVSVRDVTDEDVKSEKLSGRQGVIVEEVIDGSPAEKAGFRKGDVVTDFDGERVRSARQFTRLVQETPAGRSVQAVVLRGGQRTTLTVEPREDDGFHVFRDRLRPTPAPRVAPLPREFSRIVPDIESFMRSRRTIGVTITDLSPQLADYFGTKSGVLVTAVSENSSAAKAGVKAGDVITAVNATNVDDASDLRRAVQQLDAGAEFTLHVMRDRKSITLKGKMEERSSPRRSTIRTVRSIRTRV